MCVAGVEQRRSTEQGGRGRPAVFGKTEVRECPREERGGERGDAETVVWDSQDICSAGR